ncbi:MFS transporter [Micrococcoides hystricis]|uniref:MFS transporter n=1 Tax=Micrococcoides hystricis TaxID=1572761 RepID=A0ABV6PCP0_9MICC
MTSAPLRQPPKTLMVVLLLTMGVGPLLNYGLSATSDELLRRFSITESQFGLLATTLFVSATIVSMLLGKLADVLSIRHQLILNFGGTGVAMLLAGFANEYWILLIAMALAGPMQVIANPTTNRVIYELVPVGQRPSWIGVKQSGVQLTQLMAGLYFPAVTLWLGWPVAAVGAAVFIFASLWWSITQLPPEDPTDWAKVRRALLFGRSGVNSRAVERLPLGVWILAVVAMFGGVGMQATNLYLPLYTVRELDFSLVLGGLSAGIAGIIGVMSRIYWGRLLSRGKPASTLIMLTTGGGILGIASLMLAGDFGQVWLLWLGVALYGLTVLGTNVIVNAATLSMVDASRVGAASGITTMGMYAGFAIGPLLAGLLLEATGNFHASWLSVIAAYAICFGLAVTLYVHLRRQRPNAAARSDS